MIPMRVRVNGEDRDVRSEATVAELVDDVGGSERRLAVAVNGDVVPRERWGEMALRPDDRVEIVAAIQGG